MTDEAPTAASTTRPPAVSRVRALANFLSLMGLLAFALGWAMHWEPYILGRVALASVAAFVVSFVAILVENRASGTKQRGS